MTSNTSTGINPHTMEPMRIRKILTLQNSTHHEMSDVTICSCSIPFRVTRLDHTEGATQTHSPKQENAEVMERSTEASFIPKQTKPHPAQLRLKPARMCQSSSHPPTTNDMWRHHNMALPKKKDATNCNTFQIAPEPRNTANTTMFDGHKMLTCKYENVRVSPWWTPGSHQPRFCATNPRAIHQLSTDTTGGAMDWLGVKTRVFSPKTNPYNDPAPAISVL